MLFPLLIAWCGGTALAIQSGVNSTLARAVGSSVTASAISFAVGTLALGLLVAGGAGPLPTRELLNLPRWVWLGGVLGGFYVCCVTYAAGRLGATSTASLIVAGQLFAAVLLDHFGLLGFPVHSLSAPRLLGVVLLCLGVWLIRRY